MTKLFEQALARVRELSEEEQDSVADAVFAHLAGDHRQFGLSAEQMQDVRRIREDLREGRSHLASDSAVADLWKKCGL